MGLLECVIPTNPLKDSAASQALKESFVKQPNWKAGLVLMSENHHSWTILNFVCFTISIVVLINFLSSFSPQFLIPELRYVVFSSLATYTVLLIICNLVSYAR